MAEPITPEELEAIRAHELAATGGPWHAWDRGVGYHIAIGDELDSAGRPLRFLPEGMRTDIGRLEDAEFVARSRQDVPRLLAEVDRLKAELAEMESAAADWAARLIEEKSKTSQAESRIAEALDLAARLDPSCGRGRVQAFISDLRRALGRAVSL